jgi:N-acetylmuramoyl-L-alanine amidase
MDAVIALARDILSRRPIPPERVLGHSDVAPARKQDPGELFDWQRLAAEGIGIWPAAAEPTDMTEDEARAALTAIGYDPSAAFADVVTAFQRRWRQAGVDGMLDAETMGLIRAAAG